MLPLALPWACLLVAGCLAGCTAPGATVVFHGAGRHAFSRTERSAIEHIAEATVVEARQLLPALPAELTIRVYPSSDVIPETGETGTFLPPATVVWLVDPDRAGGVSRIAASWLRASLLHEFHHIVRSRTVATRSVMDEVIAEGMATAFERDVAGVAPPWAVYPQEVEEWVDELRSLPAEADLDLWVRGRHADGRRWIGMRAGTYLVDRAMARSGTTAAGLVSATTDDVLRMAGAGPAPGVREPGGVGRR